MTYHRIEMLSAVIILTLGFAFALPSRIGWRTNHGQVIYQSTFGLPERPRVEYRPYVHRLAMNPEPFGDEAPFWRKEQKQAEALSCLGSTN